MFGDVGNVTGDPVKVRVLIPGLTFASEPACPSGRRWRRTVLLTGAYDCALPPYLSQPLATTLSHSYHFVLPVGHAVVGSLCGLYLTDQFWANPLVPPDASCIDAMSVVWSTR